MKTLYSLAATLVILMSFIGCNPETIENSKDGQTEETDDHDHASSDHSAPNGGVIIEIGRKHEYHAEFKDDHDSETAMVYIYDHEIKPLKIEAPSVSLVLTTENDSQTFELSASGDGEGSVFTSKDDKLMEMIDSGHVDGKLRVTIEGKPMSGTFHHDPHGEDHGHDADHD